MAILVPVIGGALGWSFLNVYSGQIFSWMREFGNYRSVLPIFFIFTTIIPFHAATCNAPEDVELETIPAFSVSASRLSWRDQSYTAIIGRTWRSSWLPGIGIRLSAKLDCCAGSTMWLRSTIRYFNRERWCTCHQGEIKMHQGFFLYRTNNFTYGPRLTLFYHLKENWLGQHPRIPCALILKMRVILTPTSHPRYACDFWFQVMKSWKESKQLFQPLASANDTTRDPLLGHKIHGAEIMDIRRASFCWIYTQESSCSWVYESWRGIW